MYFYLSINGFLDHAYNFFVIPFLRLLFFVGTLLLAMWLIWILLKKLLKFKTLQSNNELLQENEQLLRDKQEWEKEKDKLNKKIDSLKNELLKQEIAYAQQNTPQMLNVGNLKVKSDHILYIVPQSLELGENGNARIKVIHYTDSPQADMVYSTFDEILEKLPGNFMLINKNQLINLCEIHKIQGLEVFLNNVKTPFYVSEQKKEEFDSRMENL